jgi:hypothetical protein
MLKHMAILRFETPPYNKKHDCAQVRQAGVQVEKKIHTFLAGRSSDMSQPPSPLRASSHERFSPRSM